MLQPVVIDGIRTPIGKLNGAMKDIQPEEIAAFLLQKICERSHLDIRLLDAVILGQAKQSSDQPNIARLAALMTKFPLEVQAYTVHRQCGSGMQAVQNAAQEIMCGYADFVLAGGIESMSNAQYYLREARRGYAVGNGILLDPNTESQPRSQPADQYGVLTMGMTAENIAEKYVISRTAQKMQRQMEEQAKEMETKEFSATAGGGAVEVTVSGSKKILKVKLDEEVVDPDDVEMLEDLLVAAVNEALEKVDAETTSAMSKFTGGMGGGMPGLF